MNIKIILLGSIMRCPVLADRSWNIGCPSKMDIDHLRPQEDLNPNYLKISRKRLQGCMKPSLFNSVDMWIGF
jgi:hypothetical protein